MAAHRALLSAGAIALLLLCTLLLVLQQQPQMLWLRPSSGDPRPSDVPLTARPARLIKGQPTVGEDHIIFLETSCALNDSPTPVPYDSDSGLRLSPRGACAVEAAAAAHPDRLVYLLHTCHVHAEALERGAAPPYALAVLAAHPNVRVWPVRYAHVFRGTPLEGWLQSGALRRSLWPVVHASDVLRFLVLWKYGGTYLDLDVLMLRSLGNETNFGCAESTLEVSVGAFNFGWDEPGRRVANACLAELQGYRPDLWSYNGPGAITRALQKVCNVQQVSQMTAERCKGFHLLPTSAFYAVPWQQWQLYFQEDQAEQVMKTVNNTLAVHVWNYLSQNTVVHTSSKEPYAQIAREVCPHVTGAVGEKM